MADFLAIECEFPLLVGNTEELRRIAQTAVSGEDVVHVTVLDPDGKVLVRVDRAKSRSRDRRAVEAGSRVMAREGSGIVDWKTFDPGAVFKGTVQVGLSTEKRAELYRQTAEGGFFVALVTLGIMLTVHYLQWTRMLLPLRSLIDFTPAGRQGRSQPAHPGQHPR